jgi:hypothetical protein
MFFENFVKFGVAAQNFLNDVARYDLLKNFACALNFTKIFKNITIPENLVIFKRLFTEFSST